jgi:thiamine biosynthesis lipoprotein
MVVYHIWKIHFNNHVTTPDHLTTLFATPPNPPERRTRREFLRPARRAEPAPTAWLRVYREAMACRVEVLLPARAAADVAAARVALEEAERIEQAWSVFREDSLLSQLNRGAATAPWPVDAELAALLVRCGDLSEATGGAFDITSTPLSRCWRLLTRDGRVPSADAIAEARACTGMALVEVEAGQAGLAGQAGHAGQAGQAGRAGLAGHAGHGGWVRFAREGVELNLGAIGKGYAVGCIAARLREQGVTEALVSAGDSSIESVGSPAGGWPIALRGGDGAWQLRLRHGAVATSGSDEQGFVSNGERLGHVLDPRTGWPTRGATRVTVVAPDAADADALATAFLVGGPALAEQYLAAHEDVLAVFALDGVARPRIMGRASGAAVEA